MTRYKISVSARFESLINKLKRKKPSLFRDLEKHIDKILEKPYLGKPLRNIHKNKRRVHVGSFVLIYEVFKDVICLLDFDHHDKIYR